jgi:N-dimethylarginine dimethylaminohydrolase
MGFTLSEAGRLTRVLMKHPRDAFIDQATIDAQWKKLNFSAPPDFARAVDEYDRFLDLVESTGAKIDLLPRHDSTTLDSMYVRDASVVCDRGTILCNMGKPQRAAEPSAQRETLAKLGAPIKTIVGTIRSPGRLEGGDVVWLGSRTVAVGEGYRTNADGIRQLRELLGDSVDELLTVQLPHWRGAGEVLHLMSLISLVDRSLAAVYSPLLPAPFRQQLLARDVELVEVPTEEFESMGTNVLALSPRRCVMLSGNPQTRRALERAGSEVLEYEGAEISVKGAGGPTCLTRPLARIAGAG